MEPNEVYYSFRWFEKSNENYFNQITEITMARNRYHFVVKPPIEEEARATGTVMDGNSTVQGSALDGGKASSLSHISDKKARHKLRKKNPNFATLEDAILKEEEKFKAEMAKDLDKCAYYPPRPALKFIPTP